MGFFSSLFKPAQKPAVNIDHGLSYRIADPFTVEVLIEQKWRECCEDGDENKKPKRGTLSTIDKYNAAAECRNELEAWAVSEVLEHMEHFCEHCGDEVLDYRKKCDECGKPLWQGRKKLQMVVRHLP
jgi:hypothetical protein